MTQTVITQKLAENIRPGDRFISAFLRTDNKYPDPVLVEDAEQDHTFVTITLETGEKLNVFRGMYLIVQERA